MMETENPQLGPDLNKAERTDDLHRSVHHHNGDLGYILDCNRHTEAEGFAIPSRQSALREH